MMQAFAVLARFKGLRGTMLDPFGYTEERRRERRLIERYEQVVVVAHRRARPHQPRGRGRDRIAARADPRLRHVKARSIEEAERRRGRVAATVQGSGRVAGRGVTASAFLMH